MKITPIIFSAPMIQALRGNRKSQSRRLAGLEEINLHPDEWKLSSIGRLNSPGHQHHGKYGAAFSRGGFTSFVACRYGGPGDLLYVRETVGDCGARLTYKADTDDGAHCMVERWTPAIHMLRSESRITLELTNLRVERLQDISQADAIAEGVNPGDAATAKLAYGALWLKINGPDSVAKNPWVWVLDFPDKIYRQNIDDYLKTLGKAPA